MQPSGKPLQIYAPPQGADVFVGATVTTVLNDVKNFLDLRINGHEAIVLKFSGFRNMGGCSLTERSASYEELRTGIVDILGKWLLVDPGNMRPANIPLETLLANGSKVIVVVDRDFASSRCNQQQPGIYVYKDWCSGNSGCTSTGDPALGDFNVYDQRSGSRVDYGSMRGDQLAKLSKFNGQMEYDPNVPCDLFLLSWIVGDPANVLQKIGLESAPANRDLALQMKYLEPNESGFIPNIISVDYYERARVTDIAIEMNSRLVSQ
jgi:hypothetical protein